MYTSIHFFNNECVKGEKKVNPVNMAITPAMIDQLTSEGKATSMHQLDGMLYYPDIPDNAELPLEMTRGVDENDCWEASQESSEKIRKFYKQKKSQPATVEEHA